jgi:ubiquinone/menaquinone biosynthesis C-methylase UbiE
MGIYSKYILPKIIHTVCQNKPTMKQRAKVIPWANGDVLEVGIGSGLNLSFYNPNKITHITGIDPSEELWKQKTVNVNDLGFKVNFINAIAEDLPFENELFDTVVITYTLCTVKNPNKALQEIKRVLKPNGKLIFCEHGLAEDTNTKKWQNLLNPIWKKVGGGCNLNRETSQLIKSSGFKIMQLEKMFLPGWKPASFNTWGYAIPINNFNK